MPTSSNQTIFAGVSYSYSRQFKKWQFKMGNDYSFLVACGGKENAAKVASIASGCIKRGKKTLDGMARANIDRVCVPAQA